MPNGSVTKVSDIDGFMLAIIAAVEAAVTYPVFDGPPTSLPARTVSQFVAIGADNIDSAIADTGLTTDSARMNQEWHGLGQVARYEEVTINCVAVGRADTVTNARQLALEVVEDVGKNIALHPTATSYNALVSAVESVKSQPTSGGAFVHVQFVITASTRLT